MKMLYQTELLNEFFKNIDFFLLCFDFYQIFYSGVQIIIS